MRLLTFIYINLKLIIKEFPATVIYMVGLPLGISLLMGFAMDIMFTNPNETPSVPIKIVDEDQSDLSQQLVSFFESDSMADFVYLTEQTTAQLEVIIPSGYEEHIFNNEQTTIEINLSDKTGGTSTATIIETILKQYHEQLQTGIASSGNLEALKVLYEDNAIKSVYIDTPIALNSITYYSIYMLGFFVFMMIMTVTNSRYKKIETGQHMRMYAAPLSRAKVYIYDTTVNVIYISLLLLVYVFIYRVLGYSFEGNLGLLLLCVVATSFFIVGIGSFIETFFSPKYGKTIANALFFVQIAFGGSFFPIDNMKYLSPSVMITEMFNSFVLHNDFSQIMMPLIMTIIIGGIFYSLCLVKIKYRLWED